MADVLLDRCAVVLAFEIPDLLADHQVLFLVDQGDLDDQDVRGLGSDAAERVLGFDVSSADVGTSGGHQQRRDKSETSHSVIS
jgi:hypothetical protein